MPDLEQLQRWMQTVIMNVDGIHAGIDSEDARRLIPIGAEEAERIVTRSETLTGIERLEIYNRAYYARLIDCLREEFPVFLHAVGEEAFDQFAIAYLQKYPSRSYTLNQLGLRFPQFLAESRPVEEMENDPLVPWSDFLVDLARLELTYSEVFDGPGVEGKKLLNADRLATIPPERWPEAKLVPVPCLRLLTLRYPVHRYYTAVRKKKAAAFPKAATTYLAITRRRYVVRRYEFSRLQFVLLDALVNGAAVGAAIRHAVDSEGVAPEEFAAQLQEWFRNWTAEGFFQEASWREEKE